MKKEVDTERLQGQVEGEIVPRFVTRVRDAIGEDFAIEVKVQYETFDVAEDVIGAYKKIAGNLCLSRISNLLEDLAVNRVAKKAIGASLKLVTIAYYEDDSGKCSLDIDKGALNYAITNSGEKLIDQDGLFMLIEELCRIDQAKSFHEIASNHVPMYISAMNENFLKRIRLEVNFRTFADISDTAKRSKLVKALSDDYGRDVLWELYKALKYLFNREIDVFDKVHCFLNTIQITATEHEKDRIVKFSKTSSTLEIRISVREKGLLLDKNEIIQSLANRMKFDFTELESDSDDEEERLMLVQWFEAHKVTETTENQPLGFLKEGLNVQIFRIKSKKLKGEKCYLTIDDNLHSLLFKNAPKDKKAKDSLPIDQITELFKGPSPVFLSDKTVKQREERTMRMVLPTGAVIELVTNPKEYEEFDSLYAALRFLHNLQKSVKAKTDRLLELYSERFRSFMSPDSIEVELSEESLLEAENYFTSKEYAVTRVMPVVSTVFLRHVFNDEVGIELARKIKKIVLANKAPQLGLEATHISNENIFYCVFNVTSDAILKFDSENTIYEILNDKYFFKAYRDANELELELLPEVQDAMLDAMGIDEDDEDFDDFLDVDFDSIWSQEMTSDQYSFCIKCVGKMLKKLKVIVDKLSEDEIGSDCLAERCEGIVIMYKPPKRVPVPTARELDVVSITKNYLMEMKSFVEKKLEDEKIIYDVFWLDPTAPLEKYIDIDEQYFSHFLNDRLGIELQRTISNKLDSESIKKFSNELREYTKGRLDVSFSVDNDTFRKSPNPVYALGQVVDAVLPEVVGALEALWDEDSVARKQISGLLKQIIIMHDQPVGSQIDVEKKSVRYNVATEKQLNILHLVMFGRKNNLIFFTKVFRIMEERLIRKFEKERIPLVEKEINEVAGKSVVLEGDWSTMRFSLNELKAIEVGATVVCDCAVRAIADAMKEEAFALGIKHYLKKVTFKYASQDEFGNMEETRMNPRDGNFVVVFKEHEGVLEPFGKLALRSALERGCEMAAMLERANVETKFLKGVFTRMKKITGSSLDIQIDWDSFEELDNKEILYRRIPEVLEKLELSFSEACQDIVTKQEVSAQLQGVVIQYEGKGREKVIKNIEGGYELREKRNLGRKLTKKEKSLLSFGELAQEDGEEASQAPNGTEVFRKAATCQIRNGYFFDVYKVVKGEELLQTSFDDVLAAFSKHYSLEEKRAHHQIASSAIPRFNDLLTQVVGSPIRVNIGWKTFDSLEKRFKSEAYQKVEGEHVLGSIRRAFESMKEEPQGEESLKQLKEVMIQHCDNEYKEVGVYFRGMQMIYVIRMGKMYFDNISYPPFNVLFERLKKFCKIDLVEKRQSLEHLVNMYTHYLRVHYPLPTIDIDLESFSNDEKEYNAVEGFLEDVSLNGIWPIYYVLFELAKSTEEDLRRKISLAIETIKFVNMPPDSDEDGNLEKRSKLKIGKDKNDDSKSVFTVKGSYVMHSAGVSTREELEECFIDSFKDFDMAKIFEGIRKSKEESLLEEDESHIRQTMLRDFDQMISKSDREVFLLEKLDQGGFLMVFADGMKAKRRFIVSNAEKTHVIIKDSKKSKSGEEIMLTQVILVQKTVEKGKDDYFEVTSSSEGLRKYTFSVCEEEDSLDDWLNALEVIVEKRVKEVEKMKEGIVDEMHKCETGLLFALTGKNKPEEGENFPLKIVIEWDSLDKAIDKVAAIEAIKQKGILDSIVNLFEGLCTDEIGKSVILEKINTVVLIYNKDRDGMDKVELKRKRLVLYYALDWKHKGALEFSSVESLLKMVEMDSQLNARRALDLVTGKLSKRYIMRISKVLGQEINFEVDFDSFLKEENPQSVVDALNAVVSENVLGKVAQLFENICSDVVGVHSLVDGVKTILITYDLYRAIIAGSNERLVTDVVTKQSIVRDKLALDNVLIESFVLNPKISGGIDFLPFGPLLEAIEEELGLPHKRLIHNLTTSVIPRFASTVENQVGVLEVEIDWRSFLQPPHAVHMLEMVKGKHMLGKYSALFDKICEDEIVSLALKGSLRKIKVARKRNPEDVAKSEIQENGEVWLDLVAVDETNKELIYSRNISDWEEDILKTYEIERLRVITEVKNNRVPLFQLELKNIMEVKDEEVPPIKIDWKSFITAGDLEHDAISMIESVSFNKIRSIFVDVCSDDVGRRELKEYLKQIRIQYQKPFSEDDGDTDEDDDNEEPQGEELKTRLRNGIFRDVFGIALVEEEPSETSKKKKKKDRKKEIKRQFKVTTMSSEEIRTMFNDQLNLKTKKMVPKLRDKVIPFQMKTVERLVGAKIAIEVDWESLNESEDLLLTLRKIPSTYLVGKHVTLIKKMCEDEIEREQLRKHLKRILLRLASPNMQPLPEELEQIEREEHKRFVAPVMASGSSSSNESSSDSDSDGEKEGEGEQPAAGAIKPAPGILVSESSSDSSSDSDSDGEKEGEGEHPAAGASKPAPGILLSESSSDSDSDGEKEGEGEQPAAGASKPAPGILVSESSSDSSDGEEKKEALPSPRKIVLPELDTSGDASDLSDRSYSSDSYTSGSDSDERSSGGSSTTSTEVDEPKEPKTSSSKESPKIPIPDLDLEALPLPLPAEELDLPPPVETVNAPPPLDDTSLPPPLDDAALPPPLDAQQVALPVKRKVKKKQVKKKRKKAPVMKNKLSNLLMQQSMANLGGLEGGMRKPIPVSRSMTAISLLSKPPPIDAMAMGELPDIPKLDDGDLPPLPDIDGTGLDMLPPIDEEIPPIEEEESLPMIEESSSSEESLSEFVESSEGRLNIFQMDKNRMVKSYWISKYGTLVDVFDVKSEFYDGVESSSDEMIQELLVRHCFIREKRLVRDLQTRIVPCYIEKISRVLKKKVSIELDYDSFEVGKRALLTLKNITDDNSVNMLWPIVGVLSSVLDGDEDLRKLATNKIRFFRFSHIHNPKATFKCRFRLDGSRERKGGFSIKGYFGRGSDIPIKVFDDCFHEEFGVKNAALTFYRTKVSPEKENEIRQAMLTTMDMRFERKAEEERIKKLLVEGSVLKANVAGGSGSERVLLRCDEAFEKLEIADPVTKKVRSVIIVHEVEEIIDGARPAKKKMDDNLMFTLQSKKLSVVIEAGSEEKKADWMKGLDIFVGLRHKHVDKLLSDIKEMDIPEFERKMLELVGARIEFRFNWDSFKKAADVATAYHYLRGDYVMQRVYSVIKEICKSDIGREAIARGVKSITFKYREDADEDSSITVSEDGKMIEYTDVFELNKKYEDSIYYSGHRKLRNDLESALLIPQKSKIRHIKKNLLQPYEKRMGDACGRILTVDIEWKSLTPLPPQLQLLSLDKITSKYLLGKAASTIEALSADDLGMRRVKNMIKGVRIRYMSEMEQQSGGKMCYVAEDGFIVDSFYLLWRRKQERFVAVCSSQKEQLDTVEHHLNLKALRRITVIDTVELKEFVLRLRDIVGKELIINVEWDTFMMLTGDMYSAAVENVIGPKVLKKIEAAFSRICFDEIGKNAVRENIRAIHIHYGDVRDSNEGEKRARTYVDKYRVLHDFFAILSISSSGKEDVQASPLDLVANAIETHCHLQEKRSSYGLQSSKLPVYEKKVSNVIGAPVTLKMNFDSFGLLDLSEKQLVDAFSAVASDAVLGRLVSVLGSICGPDKTELKFHEAFKKRLSERMVLVSIEAERPGRTSRVQDGQLFVQCKLDIDTKKVLPIVEDELREAIYDGFGLEEVKVIVQLRNVEIPEFTTRVFQLFGKEIVLDLDFLSFEECTKKDVLGLVGTDLVLGKIERVITELGKNEICREVFANSVSRIVVKFGRQPENSSHSSKFCSLDGKLLYDCIKMKSGDIAMSSEEEFRSFILNALSIEEKLLMSKLKNEVYPSLMKNITEIVEPSPSGPGEEAQPPIPPPEIDLEFEKLSEITKTDFRVLRALANGSVTERLTRVLAEICKDSIGKERFNASVRTIVIRYATKEREKTRIARKRMYFVFWLADSPPEDINPKVRMKSNSQLREYIESYTKVKSYRIVKTLREETIPMHMQYLQKVFKKRILIHVEYDNFVNDYNAVLELEQDHSAKVIFPIVYLLASMATVPPNGNDLVKNAIDRINFHNLVPTRSVTDLEVVALKSVRLIQNTLEISGAFGLRGPEGDKIGSITISMVERALISASPVFKQLIEMKDSYSMLKPPAEELHAHLALYREKMLKETSIKALATGIMCKCIGDKTEKDTILYAEGDILCLKEKKRDKELTPFDSVDSIKSGCPNYEKDESLCITVCTKVKDFSFEFFTFDDRLHAENGIQQKIMQAKHS